MTCPSNYPRLPKRLVWPPSVRRLARMKMTNRVERLGQKSVMKRRSFEGEEAALSAGD